MGAIGRLLSFGHAAGYALAAGAVLEGELAIAIVIGLATALVFGVALGHGRRD